MATGRTVNMTPANTNAEVDVAFDDTVRDLDTAETTNQTRSEQDMLNTAVDAMDDTDRRMWPPFMPR